jgi:hypothetical protein
LLRCVFACPQDIVKIHGQSDNEPKPVGIAVLDDFVFDMQGTQPWVPDARAFHHFHNLG